MAANVERIKEVLNRLPYGVLLGAFIAYQAYDYYGFTHSPDSPLLQKQSQFEEAKKQNAALQVKLRQANEFFRSLDAKKEELRRLAQQLSEMKGTLSSEVDVPAFMKLAVTEAKKIGLTVISLKPTEYKEKEYYAEQPFEMVFHGVFVQFLVFLDRISNVQNIVRVENMELHPVGNNQAKYVELEGTLELKTYKYIGSKADEIASKAEAPPAQPAGGGAKAAGGGSQGPTQAAGAGADAGGKPPGGEAKAQGKGGGGSGQ